MSLYTLKNNYYEKIEYNEIDNFDQIVGYLNVKDFKRLYKNLGIHPIVLEQIREGLSTQSEFQQNILSAWDEFSFGIINILDTKDIFNDRDMIGIYFDEHKFICIDLTDLDGSTRNAFQSSIRNPGIKKGGVARVFSLFIRELIKDNVILYERVSRRLEDLDLAVQNMKDSNKEIERKISLYNHELLEIYGYYQQLGEVCSELNENYNEIFTDDELGYITSLSNRIDRYANNISLLREYCNQIRTSYQAQIDLYLNQIMKIFTVVTTIFLPLTLIAGWYGMNFRNMPELESRYGYPGVIILSILVVVISIFYFKKRKLM